MLVTLIGMEFSREQRNLVGFDCARENDSIRLIFLIECKLKASFVTS
jgi:hypothetical protein